MSDDNVQKLLKEFIRGKDILNRTVKLIDQLKLKSPLTDKDHRFINELGDALDNLTKELDSISDRIEKS
jgi:hypothetical protein